MQPVFGYTKRKNVQNYVKEWKSTFQSIYLSSLFFLTVLIHRLRLQSIPPPKSINHGSQSNVLPSPTIPYNQSITLDYLFASATSNSSHASNSSLRSNQSPPDLPPKSLPQLGGGNKHPTGMSLLDSIFKSASQVRYFLSFTALLSIH